MCNFFIAVLCQIGYVNCGDQENKCWNKNTIQTFALHCKSIWNWKICVATSGCQRNIAVATAVAVAWNVFPCWILCFYLIFFVPLVKFSFNFIHFHQNRSNIPFIDTVIWNISKQIFHRICCVFLLFTH